MLSLLELDRVEPGGRSMRVEPVQASPEANVESEGSTLERTATDGTMADAPKPGLIGPGPSESSVSETLTTEAWLAESSLRETGVDAASEYELVVGRRQIASWLFVGVLVIGATATFAYLAGKTAKQTPAATAVKQTPAVSQDNVAPPKSDAIPQATIIRIPEPQIQDSNAGLPLFADPEVGKTYLQIGAVSKGMAVILVEGLRSHGFRSFVAPGPSVNVFRVLIGPFKDQQAYAQAKSTIDSIELGSFARKYERSADEVKPIVVSPPPAGAPATPAN